MEFLVLAQLIGKLTIIGMVGFLIGAVTDYICSRLPAGSNVVAIFAAAACIALSVKLERVKFMSITDYYHFAFGIIAGVVGILIFVLNIELIERSSLGRFVTPHRTKKLRSGR